MSGLRSIAETNNFIILDKYEKIKQSSEYQSEADLERELISDLVKQGYEYKKDIKSRDKLLSNARVQIQRLNNIEFQDSEWDRFVSEYLDKPGENMLDKTLKIHDDYIYDFIFDDGSIKNIYLIDKKNIAQNVLQVINQYEAFDTYENRYDVTILINGLPLVHIELKKRGVAIKEAFNQMHRYSKESFNGESSLFKYLQIFIISNGTDTRYFANTTKRDKNSFDFTMNWAKADNTPIKDLKDFTATFLIKNTILNVLINYSVFDASNTLLIMRPYQIAATERILWRIKSVFSSKNQADSHKGGYIWHTTGSGKTLTSFKAARLATGLEFIDKVFFVVDRKDLDYQTMKEYQRFDKDSVNGSDSTVALKLNLQKNDNKIIVTTIQKLNNLIKSENELEIYKKSVVFIFDECHRSQFGQAQKNLKRKFKRFCQFGFTGTPIFQENTIGDKTTAEIFGKELHSYIITDAIRDEKVLKFKVDYNDVRPKFKSLECETDDIKLTAAENKEALLHPERIDEISRYILNNFKQKTHRLNLGSKGFNAMFAVSSVEAAKLYYEAFRSLQKHQQNRLKVATIFSYAPNEEQNAIGEVAEENFEPNAMDMSSKEFLSKAINEYNAYFKTNFGVDSKEFQNYYRDLAKRVKNVEIDILIVVGMFLTGFDAPRLNTLFVDKNLRYHGLIQAFSRTNRILDATKTFGNIVTFRDLEQDTIDAIKLFGDSNIRNIVLEKSYDEYMEGFRDDSTGEVNRGYTQLVSELKSRFEDISKIETESQKREFVKLFSEYMRIENILQNYDEFTSLKAFQKLDKSDKIAVEEFKNRYYLTDEDLNNMEKIEVLSDRVLQDYRSTYNDIREWLRREKASAQKDKTTMQWDDIVFEVDLLKSQEINLDYILELIFENNKKIKDKNLLIEEARRTIRASLGNRAKEGLIIDFINKTNLDNIYNKADLIEEFFKFARSEQQREANELICDQNLNNDAAIRYIKISLKREYASDNGTELNEILPKMSPLNPQYLTKKQSVFEKIMAFVEKFKGVGGDI